MTRAPIAEIERVVRAVVARSSLSEKVRQVDVEADRDNDGFEFLRVIMTVREPDELTWAILRPVVREIEDEVDAIDERFPSIGLAEAA